MISAARRTFVAWRTTDAFTSDARRPSTVLAGAALVLAATYSYAILAGGGDVLMVVPLVAAVVVVAVVAHPIVGLYLLFGGAILFEQVAIDGGILPITAFAHFFQNLSAFTPLPVRLSQVDLLALLTLASWAARIRSGRVPKPRLGPFGWAVAGFGLIFVAGAVFGVARGEGFDSDAALAELRAPVHLCVAYFLAANLVRRREHVEVLLWSFVLLVGVKALQAILNYLDAAPLSVDLQAVTSHEDVVFFGTAVSLAVALVALGVRSRLGFVMVAVQPLIGLALILDERRVGFVGLGVGLLIVTILIFAADRRRGLVLATVFVVAATGYVAMFWDASGALAEPIRPLKTIVEPSSVSARDALSNVFRDIENRNIARTVRAFPLTGVGLGQQYLIIEVPQWLDFTYWRYMTHNGLLWIWLKAGPLAALIFWFLVARVLLLCASWYRTLRDDRLNWVPVLPVLLIATQITFSAVELGLPYSRTMIVLGAMLGLGAYLDRLAASRPLPRPAASRG